MRILFMTRYSIYMFAIIISFLAGCSQTDDGTEHHDPPDGSVTVWTSKTELFMEHPALIAGDEIRFAVHLTWLSDFKPVNEAKLTLEFITADGSRLVASADTPTSPGIYRPVMSFDSPGIYDLTVIVDGRSKDTLHVGEIKVFATAEEVPPEDPTQEEPLITFLKEQQWKIDFRTEPAVLGSISGTVRAACEIVPRLNSEAIVTAPFTGIIPAEENQRLPVVGQQVGSGARLAVMIPSAETPGGNENFLSRFVDAETDLSLADKEFERAKHLRSIDGISDREYQETEAEYKRAYATFHTLSKYAHPNSADQFPTSFTLNTPLSGTIVEAHVVPGKQVNAGDPLYRIINTSSVWIRADVASTEVGRLAQPRRAWLRLAGIDETFEVNERNGTLVSIAPAIDPMTRTFPVIFEVRNPERTLRIGMFGEIIIATGRTIDGLVIPISALLEEEGRYSVYVHVEGEGFAKRDVVLGERNGDYVEVRSGISEGERVVTEGAYQVRLASFSSQLPAHGHEH
jgi:membrane fusion protein, heavy metal efflux system